MGGLGLRSLREHAAAAYLASVSSTADLQCAIFHARTSEEVMGSPAALGCVDAIEARAPNAVEANLRSGGPVLQKNISKALDRASCDSILQDATTSLDFKAHLHLVGVVGADAWLHALPSADLGTKMDSELFRIGIARRLRIRLLNEPSACLACGSALDVYMDHALTCCCGGIALYAIMRFGTLSSRRQRRRALGPSAKSQAFYRPGQRRKPRMPLGRQ